MTKIQLRRGTAAQWTSVNPVLASGEMGIETDTNKFKFGDGVTAWNNLDYVITGEVITDYTKLDNLPSINNITLTGNKSASDLGLQEELINSTGILISGTTISVDDSVVAMRSDIPDVSNFVTNSSLSTTLQDYQPVLESGTNIKTINNQSLLGSGNIEIQSGGTYSEGTGIDITNGVISVDTDTVALKSDIPSLTGYATQTWVQNQNYLTSISSSDVISALGYTPYSNANPNNYTSNIGTVTSVNGTQPDANGNVSITIPDNTDFMDLSTNQTAYGTKTFNDLRVHQYIRNVDGKVIFYGVGSSFSIGDTTCELTLDGSTTRPYYYNGTTNSEMALLSDIPDIDNSTITKNSDDELQAIGVIDNNSGGAIKTWTGTKAQYDAITTKDANTLYNITDDTDVTLSLLELLFPVGAVYFGIMSTCPLQTLGVGTWQALPPDKVIQIAGTRGNVGTTINESLPNHTHIEQLPTSWGNRPLSSRINNDQGSGTIKSLTSSPSTTNDGENFSVCITTKGVYPQGSYQDNAPVQQDAYLLNGWRRIA